MQQNNTLLPLVKNLGLKLAVAESLTGGNLQALVSAVSGISSVFEGGITAYNEDQKVRLLKIDRKHAQESNCVSERVAEEMAKGVCGLFECSLGVATTGYAEPDSSRSVDEPFAFWAIHLSRTRSPITMKGRVDGTGLNRVQMQTKVAVEALDALIHFLKQLR